MVGLRRACALGLSAALWALVSRAHADGTDDARRNQVIVSASGVSITVGQVEDLIAQQAPALRLRYKDEGQLKELVENLLRTELLSREAERRGYDKRANVRYAVKESAAQALVRRIESSEPPARDERVMPCELVVRASTIGD